MLLNILLIQYCYVRSANVELRAIETYAALREIAESAEVWNLRDRDAGKKGGSDQEGPHPEDVKVM